MSADDILAGKAALAAYAAVAEQVQAAIQADDDEGLAAQAASADFAATAAKLDALLLDSSDEDDWHPGGDPATDQGVVVAAHADAAICGAAMVDALARTRSGGHGDSWSAQLCVQLPGEGSSCEVRPVREGDEELLLDFGLRGLSDASRASFAPYPWDAPVAQLRAALTAAVANSLRKQDLHFIAIASGVAPAVPDVSDRRGKVVGHCFLWSASEAVPELGLAVADAWQVGPPGLHCSLRGELTRGCCNISEARLGRGTASAHGGSCQG